MPEIADKPFRPQITSPRVSLPHIPALPEELLKRFPTMRDYAEEQASWWSRTRKLLSESAEEMAFVQNNANHNFNLLSEKTDELAAAIISLSRVMADEDSALAEQINALSSSVGDGARTKTLVQPSPPDESFFDLIEGDLWFDSDNDYRVYRWNGDAWVEIADGRITGAVAAITTIQTTYADKDYVEAKKSEAILAAGTYADASTLAAVNTITTAYTSADTTLSNRITSLESKVDTPETGLLARVTTVESTKITLTQAQAEIATAIAAEVINRDLAVTASSTALTNAYTLADAALNTTLGTRITSLESSVDGPTTGLLARVNTIETTYATELFAEAKKTEAIDAASLDATAKVAAEATARSDADEALAEQIATISATNARTNIYRQPSAPTPGPGLVAGDLWFDSDDGDKIYRYNGSAWELVADNRIAQNAALISTIQTTYATDAEVSAAINTALISAANDAQARVDTEASTRATADGHLSGKYTLKVTAGNVVTGFNITSASGPGGDTSEVTFQADRFKIFNGTSGLPMFDVSTSQVRLGGVLVVDTPGQKVFIGTGTYNNANTPFFVDSTGALSLKNKLTWNPATDLLTITGSVTATAGTIGGWDINPTTISKNGAVLDSAGALTLGATSEIVALSAVNATHRLWVGSTDPNTAPFRVTKGGALTATNANITGAITATSGSIAGTIIQDNTITTGKIQANAITTDKLAVDSVTAEKIKNGEISTAKLSFTVTGSDNVIAQINASTEGGGTLRISSNKIHVSGNTTFEATYDPSQKVATGGAAADVNANLTTISGDKIRSGLIQSNNWGASAGSEYDLVNGTIKLGGSSAPKFSVTSAGVLTATGAIISGAITATSGTFTGTVSGSSIEGGTVDIGTGSNRTYITGSGLAVGSILLNGSSGQNTIAISGSYGISINGGNAVANITVDSGDRRVYLADGGITFGLTNSVRLGRSGDNAMSTTGSLTAGKLATSNFEASVTTAVDVKDVNFRIFNSGVQTFRVDCTTGHIYINNNRVVGSRGSRGSASLADVVALLDSWNAWA